MNYELNKKAEQVAEQVSYQVKKLIAIMSDREETID